MAKSKARAGNADFGALLKRVPTLPEARLEEASRVARFHPFRATGFYLERVLNGRADDPLLDVVLPSDQELTSRAETWDENQNSPVRAVDSPLWSQKYPQEGLIRLNTYCSSLCRYCYVREQTEKRLPASNEALTSIFDQLSAPTSSEIREVILSGGDPLTASPHLLSLIGSLLRLCNEKRRQLEMRKIQVTVHTREPVWRPDYYLNDAERYEAAFGDLGAYAYVFQVIHPREVTPELLKLVALIASAGHRRPLLLLQHPLFRGINASAEILAELYQRLAEGDAPIKPYYVVHPFDSGTLQKHRLSIPESQGVMRELFRTCPGILMPTLVVPTSVGKAYISPYERLVAGSGPGRWRLTTKNGETVEYLDLAVQSS